MKLLEIEETYKGYSIAGTILEISHDAKHFVNSSISVKIHNVQKWAQEYWFQQQREPN